MLKLLAKDRFLYSSCLNSRSWTCKRNNVKRLFKGEAYRPYRLRYNL
ncbi:MAG: hypothetical protein LBJ00_16745 [Planctomycetaceae bacterium]|nr:hypothetical protein [Planctomycetaceae bacterium]